MERGLSRRPDLLRFSWETLSLRNQKLLRGLLLSLLNRVNPRLREPLEYSSGTNIALTSMTRICRKYRNCHRRE